MTSYIQIIPQLLLQNKYIRYIHGLQNYIATQVQICNYMHSKGGGISLTCLTTANYNLSYSLVAFIDGFKGVRSNTPQK